MHFLSEDLRIKYSVELRDKFLSCGLDKPDTRERVLGLMPAKIRQYVSRSDIDATAVLNIITRCIEYNDGVELLAFVLRQVNNDTASLDELDELTRKVSRMPISYVRRRKLLDYASNMNWPNDALKKAYRRIAPEGWVLPDFSEASDAPALLAMMVEDATSMGRRNNGTFPVLEFVERLALYAQEEGCVSVCGALQEWVKWRAFDLDLGDDYIHRMRARIEEERISRIEKVPYLLVMLDTAHATAETTIPVEDRAYNVQAWLVDEAATFLVEQIVLDDTPRKLVEVSQLLGTLIEKYQDVESLGNSIDNLVIEFLVPDELLSYGFDAWRVRIEDNEFELGIEYHVVVRSARRATNPRRRSAWQNKWAALQKAMHMERSAEGFVCICGPEGCLVRGDPSCAILFCSRADCQEQSRLQAMLRRSPIVYLALAHADFTASAGATSTHGNRVLQTILYTGMPVALWPRKHASSAAAITSLLSHDALGTLPEKVWKWRKAMVIGGEASGEGQHLSLLWDDPSRLPPTVSQLGAPAGNE